MRLAQCGGEGDAAAGEGMTVAPTPVAAAGRREDLDCIRAGIQRLRPRLRELLLLKVQESKSYKEIAQITGLSVTNVGFCYTRR